jgi:excisionase family DNA binding protein
MPTPEQRREAPDRRNVARGGRREGDYVSPGWLADFWGVHPNTVYRDIRKGALPACRMPGGQYRVLRSDAMRYGRPVE